MRARLIASWDDVRSSYWFIPTLMAIGAVVLSFVATDADARVGDGWIGEISWLYANKPDGARTLLSTVAGSMIGVAGVTFSITIASVVYASGQYGPRLLANFMRDRGNQVTLGTFIATFLYCLLVLRTIRAADEPADGAEALVGAFVPHIAILVGLGLAVASIAVLIFFIHHIPDSILVSNVIAGIGRQLVGRIAVLFPEPIGTPGPVGRMDAAEPTPDYGPTAEITVADVPDGFLDRAVRVAADGTGYLESVDTEAIFQAAVDEDLLIRLRYRPGDFVTEGEALALVWPPDAGDDVAATIRRSFVWGRSRSQFQDNRFLINELVEIAARALSPGVNDPFTAITCLDWLGAALKRTAGRDFPSESRHDDDGTLRLVALPSTYTDLIEQAFGQLRPYLAGDRNAALHALKVLAEVAGATQGARARDALRDEAAALLAAAVDALNEGDAALVRERHRVVAGILANRSYEATAAEVQWLGGSA